MFSFRSARYDLPAGGDSAATTYGETDAQVGHLQHQRLFLLGSFYDFGALTKWLGNPDGRDHAAVILTASSTTVSYGNVTIQNMISGPDFQVPGPDGPSVAQISTAISTGTILPST